MPLAQLKKVKTKCYGDEFSYPAVQAEAAHGIPPNDTADIDADPVVTTKSDGACTQGHTSPRPMDGARGCEYTASSSADVKMDALTRCPGSSCPALCHS